MSAVTNAIAFMKSRRIWQFFSKYWAFTDGTIINNPKPLKVPPLAHFLTPLAQI
jgi:hypothetical protein